MGRRRRSLLRVLPILAAASLASPGTALAAGGDYVFDGGTAKERATVVRALEASAFDWDVVPTQVTVHVAPSVLSHATPGHVWLDADLLRAGMFSWATVQDEYAHQVDFFLLDPSDRERLTTLLGARDWCYGVQGLEHGEYGCERFASTLVWSYWPHAKNAYKPLSPDDESAAMAPPAFRALMVQLVGVADPLTRRSSGSAPKR